MNFLTKTITAIGLCLINTSIMANPYSGRVINGSNLFIENAPSTVPILMSASNGDSTCFNANTGQGQRCGQLCGGVYLGGNWVVTASHCILGNENQNFYVNANVSQWNGTNGDYAQVVEIINHPEFNQYGPGQFANDITLLRLNTTLANTQAGVLTSCEITPNTISFVVGWGATSVQQNPDGSFSGANFSQTLMSTDVPIGDLNQCNTLYYQNQLNNNQHICAGSRIGGKDSCNGDSGGPLIQDLGGIQTVVGLTSFGSTLCGAFDSISVYTRLGSYIDWIQTTTGLPLNINNNCAVDPYDSDNDFVPDYREVSNGTDANDPSSFIDIDGDGVPAYVEAIHQTSDLNLNNYLDLNSNFVPDYQELIDGTYNTNQNDISARGDGGGSFGYLTLATLGLLIRIRRKRV